MIMTLKYKLLQTSKFQIFVKTQTQITHRSSQSKLLQIFTIETSKFQIFVMDNPKIGSLACSRTQITRGFRI